MIYDLQKASMWKRISAFLFDLILLSIVSVLFAWVLSQVLGYDGYQQRLDDAYTRVGEEYGIDLRMPLAEYNALDEAGRSTLNAAYDALSADADATRTYSMLIQLTILISSIAILLGYLVMEFAVPLKLGNGRTLGKKAFGLAVMYADGVRLRAVGLFTRTVLGKYAVETMIPVIILMMVFWGTIGVIGPIVLFAILAVEAAVMVGTKTNAMIHDLLATTVVVDYASQMIFETREDMIRYKEKIHAEMAAKQEY